jgi:hypothetical protein
MNILKFEKTSWEAREGSMKKHAQVLAAKDGDDRYGRVLDLTTYRNNREIVELTKVETKKKQTKMTLMDKLIKEGVVK